MASLRNFIGSIIFLALASVSSQSIASTALITRAEDGPWCIYRNTSVMMDAVSKKHFLLYASAKIEKDKITELVVHTYGDEYDVFTTDRYFFSASSQDYSVKRTISAPSDGNYHKSFFYKFHADKLVNAPAGDGIYDDIIKNPPYPKSYFNIFDLVEKFSKAGGDALCE